MSRNSKTLIQIEDLTPTTVGMDIEGRMHITIGNDDEHQVEVVASPRVMLGLVTTVADQTSTYMAELERMLKVAQGQLAKWVQQG